MRSRQRSPPCCFVLSPWQASVAPAPGSEDSAHVGAIGLALEPLAEFCACLPRPRQVMRVIFELHSLYRSTSLITRRPLPEDPHRPLGMVLL